MFWVSLGAIQSYTAATAARSSMLFSDEAEYRRRLLAMQHSIYRDGENYTLIRPEEPARVKRPVIDYSEDALDKVINQMRFDSENLNKRFRDAIEYQNFVPSPDGLSFTKGLLQRDAAIYQNKTAAPENKKEVPPAVKPWTGPLCNRPLTYMEYLMEEADTMLKAILGSLYEEVMK